MWIIFGNESEVVLIWVVNRLTHGLLIQVGWIPCVSIVKGRLGAGLSVDRLIGRVHVDSGTGRRVIDVLSQHVLPHSFLSLPFAVAVAGDEDNDGESDDTSDDYSRDESGR